MRYLIPAIALALIPGLVHADDTAARVERLQRDITTLQQYVYRSGGAPAGAQSPAPGGTATAQLMELQEQLRQMNGRIEQMEFGITQLQQDLKRTQDLQKAQAEIMAGQQQAAVANPAPTAKEEPLKKTDEAKAEAPAPSATTPATTPKPVMRLVKNTPDGQEAAAAPKDTKQPYNPEDPQNMYDYAFGLLSNGDYAKAETVFSEFVKRHQKHDLTGNAYYWLGETFYARAAYDKAAVQFLKGYQEFPKSSKAPDNLFKLGMALENLGKTKEACTTLTKLSGEFPNAEATLKKRVTDESKKLSCNG